MLTPEPAMWKPGLQNAEQRMTGKLNIPRAHTDLEIEHSSPNSQNEEALLIIQGISASQVGLNNPWSKGYFLYVSEKLKNRT